MRISVEGNLPKAFGLSRAELKKAAAYFAMRSSVRIGVPFHTVAVILQDDAASDAAHRAIMDVAGATDVITQGYEAIPPEPNGVYGELYVNCDQALRVAPKRHGWSTAKELLLYVAHGMDHLSGADDHKPCDYAKMRRRELAWLKDWERETLASDAFRLNAKRVLEA